MPKPKSQQKAMPSLPAFRFPPEKRDLPATQGMLQLVRTELKSDIRELRSEMKAEFSNMKAEFSRTDAKLEHVLSDVARIGVLVEEQNSNNRIVLEGLTGLWQRQEQVELVITEKIDYAVSAALGRTKA